MKQKKMELVQKIIDGKMIVRAEKCLIDNGIEASEVSTVLQAIGYILLDIDLYEEADGLKD